MIYAATAYLIMFILFSLQILLNPYFSLADPETFDSIFLEPKQSEPDCLLVNGTSAETSQLSICLHDRTDERISQVFLKTI